MPWSNQKSEQEAPRVGEADFDWALRTGDIPIKEKEVPQYDNTNRGSLFKNDKEGNEKRPDYTGKINVAGVDYRLSAWVRKSKEGKPYMSLSIGDAKAAVKKDADIPF